MSLRIIRAGAIALLISAASLTTHGEEPAAGDTAITVMYPPDGAAATALGHLQLSGVGEVSLVATRKGARLVVDAKAPDGTPIGRAESVMGLAETPLYVRSSSGLRRITIHWESGMKATDGAKPK